MSAVLEIDVFAAQNRDALAFNRLVDASKNVVASIAFAILRDPALSEEIAQDVYLEVWNGIGSLRNPSSFLPWLRQLTRNRAHECRRSRVRYRKRHASWTSDAEEVASAIANASDRIVASEESAALADALERLPEETREIVTLFYREGESIRQVATLLGLSESAVKKRLERGRDALRGAMLERFADAAKKTAPGNAFNEGVAGAIAFGAPTTASTLGSSAKLAASSKLASLFVPLGAATLGAAAAFLGISFQIKAHLDAAHDAREKHELEALRFRAGMVVVIAMTWMMGSTAVFSLSKLLASIMCVVGLAAFEITLHVLMNRELPRILDRHGMLDADRPKRRWGLAVGVVCSWGCLGFAIYRFWAAP